MLIAAIEGKIKNLHDKQKSCPDVQDLVQGHSYIKGKFFAPVQLTVNHTSAGFFLFFAFFLLSCP